MAGDKGIGLVAMVKGASGNGEGPSGNGGGAQGW